MQLQTGVKMGWTRLYDMAGVTTLSSAIIANNDWMKDAKNQDALRRFLRASQRGWQYSFDNRAEAAEIFRKAAPVFTQEIALLEVDGTMSIIRTERTKGKPIAWSDAGDWKDSQELLEKFAKLKRAAGRQRLLHQRLPVGGAVHAQEVSERAVHPAARCRQDLRHQGRRGGSVRRRQPRHPRSRSSSPSSARAAAARPPSSRWWPGCVPYTAGSDHRRRAPRRAAAHRRGHRVPGVDPARLAQTCCRT